MPDREEEIINWLAITDRVGPPGDYIRYLLDKVKRLEGAIRDHREVYYAPQPNGRAAAIFATDAACCELWSLIPACPSEDAK